MSLLKEYCQTTILEGSNLSASEMLRRPYRFDLFLKKMKEGTPFTDMDGNIFTIPTQGNQALVDALKQKNALAYKAAFKNGVMTSNEFIITRPTIIKKTGEFGGIGSRQRLEKEDIQIAQINSALNAIGEPVSINLGQKTAENVVACHSVSGNPKADASLVDVDGKKVGFISLKYANLPSQMQQWGGFTKYISESEVQEFIVDVNTLLDTSPGGRLDTAYYRVIKNPALVQALVYGDRSSPENTVDLVIASQSEIGLSAKEGANNFVFVATNVFYFPDIPPDNWAPTFYATYRSNRNDLGLKNTRVGCYPLGFRANKKELPTHSPEVNEPTQEVKHNIKNLLLAEYIHLLFEQKEQVINKLRVFDFDDTLVKTDSKVYVTHADGGKLTLTPGEFAVYEAQEGDVFDYSDFEKLINPKQIRKVVNIMKRIVTKRGPEGAIMLTARANPEPVTEFLNKNNLYGIEVIALGSADPLAKADHIARRIEKDNLTHLEFFDDSLKNIKAVEALVDIYPDVDFKVRHITYEPD